MAGIGQIAKSLGHQVSGCDANVYPPMSTVLAEAGIPVMPGYLVEHIDPEVDCVLIGNALSRGNPIVEHVLNNKLNYDSGPAWLAKNVLAGYQVIAVAGTHGKTSTAAMVSLILHQLGLSPGFLIGGKPGNFAESARLGDGQYFVIEADEYDTAFFDKRSKFVHYGPSIAILNNLEFDHADIFDDIDQIIRQFHHLVRIVPANGSIVVNQDDSNLSRVMDMGMWSKKISFSTESTPADWSAQNTSADSSAFSVFHLGQKIGEVQWSCIGTHNMTNGLAAIAATAQAGVDGHRACEALSEFIPSARRLERLFYSDNYILYEDFAHHPTAIAKTLTGLRAAHPDSTLIAIIEPRSNTMAAGHHNSVLGQAIAAADHCVFYSRGTLDWNPEALVSKTPIKVSSCPEQLLQLLPALFSKKNIVVAMSNGDFDGIPGKIKSMLVAGHPEQINPIKCN